MSESDQHHANAAPEDVKAKFKEALDRKRSGKGGQSATDDGDRGKIHGAHGSASHQKQFRRKSG